MVDTNTQTTPEIDRLTRYQEELLVNYIQSEGLTLDSKHGKFQGLPLAYDILDGSWNVGLLSWDGTRWEINSTPKYFGNNIQKLIGFISNWVEDEADLPPEELKIDLPGLIFFVRLPKEPATCHSGLVLWKSRESDPEEWVSHRIDIDWVKSNPTKVRGGLASGNYYYNLESAIKGYQSRLQEYLDHYEEVMNSLRERLKER